MLLPKRLFKHKKQIAKKTLQAIKKHAKSGKIDKDEMLNVLDNFKKNVLSKPGVESFVESLTTFLAAHPFLQEIQDLIQKDEMEFLEKISEEALENIMETDPKNWSTLLEELASINNDNFLAWLGKTPPQVKVSIIPQI